MIVSHCSRICIHIHKQYYVSAAFLIRTLFISRLGDRNSCRFCKERRQFEIRPGEIYFVEAASDLCLCVLCNKYIIISRHSRSPLFIQYIYIITNSVKMRWFKLNVNRKGEVIWLVQQPTETYEEKSWSKDTVHPQCVFWIRGSSLRH